MDRAQPKVKDTTFEETKALGTADATVTTTGFDLGALSARGAFLAEPLELLIEAPALNTTQLPDGDTNTYSIETDDNSGFSSAKILADKVILQTGAGGAGALAAIARFRLPTDVEQFLRVKSVLAGGTGDCSGASMIVSLRF